MFFLWIFGVLVILVLFLIVSSKYNITKRNYYKYIKKYDNDTMLTYEVLVEEDIKDLPESIQRYLRYVGVVGKEKVKTFSVKMEGEMRMSIDQDFAPINVIQKSYISPDIRLFYMDMKFRGLKISGLHHYFNNHASMIVKILDLFKVVNESGDIMNQSETVTVLNDMFLLAPSSLIDSRIKWRERSKNSAIAIFTSGNITVSAEVEINDEGKLINFISKDRYALIKGEQHNVPWSTPITEYRVTNGLNLPYKGSAIWHFPDYDFEYIKLIIDNIEYNE